MIFRLIFLIIFLIIGILFTVGYNFFPIINFKSDTLNGNIFINKLELTQIIPITRISNATIPNATIPNAPANENTTTTITATTTTNFSDLNIDSNYRIALQYLYYGCIITSCLIGGGIIFSYLRMKFISKILFILAQTFMTTFMGILTFMFYSSSMIENIIPVKDYQNLNKSYGSGGILMILATAIMIVNYIIYSFIG
jgi:hypothetical protein